MARKVPGPPPGAEFDYIPTWGDNAKAEGEDRIVVKIRYLTEQEKRKAKAHLKFRYKLDGNGRPELDENGNLVSDVTEEEQSKWEAFLIDAGVVSVSNYVDQKDAPIETGADLYTRGEWQIAEQVLAEILNGLSMLESEKKSYSGSPASPPEEPAPSDGTATSAESEASTLPEAATSRVGCR